MRLGDGRRRRPLERQDLDRVLRPHRAESLAVEKGARSALGRPLLARPEVVDVAEHDVAHRPALGDGEREREERDPALRVHRSVDRIDDDTPRAPRSEPRVRRAPPRRARSPRRARRAARRRRPRPPGRSPSCRRRPRRAAGRARARRASAAARARPRMSATQSRQVSSQGVIASSGWKRSPESGFGKKYVLFCGMRSPRRATANTSSTRGSRRRNATSAPPRSTAATASVALGRVADAVEAVPVDELDVELAFRAAHELDAPAAIRDARPTIARLARRAPPAPRVEICDRLALARAPTRSGRPAKTRWVGNTCRPGVVDGDDERHDPCTVRRARVRARPRSRSDGGRRR